MNEEILALFVEMIHIAYCNKDSDKKVYVDYHSSTNSINVTYFYYGANDTDRIYLDWEYSDTERTIERCKKIKTRIVKYFEEAI